MFLLILLICCMLSWWLTWRILLYTKAKSILAMPNHRSSHTIPTPQGGGIAFVVCFLSSACFLWASGFVTTSLFQTVGYASLSIALIGFLDDRKPVTPSSRFITHLVTSIFVVYSLGGMPSIMFFSWVFPSGWVLSFLAVLYLVWLVNLYNFMDGIDGIAGGEAVSVCLAMALLYSVLGLSSLLVLPLLLCSVVLGFLFWNVPSAKIFMGDVGSGFLGLTLGIFSIQSAMTDCALFWSWLILLGVFIVDATVTLFRRMWQRERIFEGHCSHAYQHASRQYQSHFKITSAVILLNCVWLFPISALVAFHRIDGLLGLIVSYCPLLYLALKFKAGKK